MLVTAFRRSVIAVALSVRVATGDKTGPNPAVQVLGGK